MKSSPKVTIGIPTRNRAALLKTAIDSAISQDYSNLEVLVSNNASSDETLSVIASFKERVRSCSSEEIVSIAANWNRLLQMSKGDYFLLLSDDDFLAPGAISSLVETFEMAGQKASLVYGASDVLDVRTGCTKSAMWCQPPESESGVEFILASYNGRRYYPTGATLLRTKEMLLSGGYSWGEFNLVLDMAMAVKVASLQPLRRVMYIPKVVFTSVQHDSNLTGKVKLTDWGNEIFALSSMAAEKLSGHGVDKHAVLRAADAYLIHFVFNLAIAKRRTVYDYFQLFGEAVRISARHLNVTSVWVFIASLSKYLLPEKIFFAIRTILK